MNIKLFDAGFFPEYGGNGLCCEISGENWFIPTDEATCEALKPLITKNAIRVQKLPYQGPSLDDLIK